MIAVSIIWFWEISSFWLLVIAGFRAACKGSAHTILTRNRVRVQMLYAGM
jgi:hypothetical protein